MGHLQQMEAVALFIRNIVTRRRNSPNQRLYHYRVQVGEHLIDSLVVGVSKIGTLNMTIWEDWSMDQQNLARPSRALKH
jgi:hypothetical protein